MVLTGIAARSPMAHRPLPGETGEGLDADLDIEEVESVGKLSVPRRYTIINSRAWV